MTPSPNLVPLALIVEDDADLSNIFATALRKAGYQPEVIGNGSVANERLTVTEPALVVLDLHLPGMDGLEILRNIRADARLSKTKVMVVSADALMTEEARQLADKTLMKPISFSLLRELAMRLRTAS